VVEVPGVRPGAQGSRESGGLVTDWITVHYDFGIPIKGFFFSGAKLKKLGFRPWSIFESKDKAEELFTFFRDYFPSDAILVRVRLYDNKDGIMIYVVSSTFKRTEEGSEFEIVDVDFYAEE